MKKILLLLLMFAVMSCGGTGGLNNDPNPNTPDGIPDPNNPNDPDNPDNQNNNNNNNNGISITSIVVKSNGTEIGNLVMADGYSYTFVNSLGYMASINSVTGYLDYEGSYAEYDTGNCTTQEYIVTYTDYPLSTYYVFRDTKNPNKMFHTTSNVQNQRILNSYWNGSCFGYTHTEWTQPTAEITEATSGIKLQYNTPIILEEQ
jgi:hypothetical protein